MEIILLDTIETITYGQCYTSAGLQKGKTLNWAGKPSLPIVVSKLTCTHERTITEPSNRAPSAGMQRLEAQMQLPF